MDFEKIYAHTPVVLQNVLCSFEGFRIKRKRYGKRFYNILHQAVSRDFMPADQLFEFKCRKLINFLKHCQKNVPYYNSLFSLLKVKPDDFRQLSDLGQLPVLDKKTVQNNYQLFNAVNIPERNKFISHTSGTTGGGASFLYDSRGGIRAMGYLVAISYAP